MAIDSQLAGKITGMTILRHEIPQASTPGGNGFSQDGTNGRCQQSILRGAYDAGGPIRMYSGKKQGFAGVNVAHAHHHLGIHDEGLHRQLTIARAAVQIGTIKAALQGLGTEIADQGMLLGGLRGPEKETEPAGIPQTQAPSLLHDQVQMIVGPWRSGLR